MERRKFVIGAGALATGSAAALGTGAFSTVEADRSVSVEVTDDASAYLSLTSGNTGLSDYVDENGDTIEILLDGSNVDGDGLNPDAKTTFDSLLTVGNQGSQPVDVTVTVEDNSGFVTLETDNEEDFAGGVTISDGESEDIDVTIDLTGETSTGDFSTTVTFDAQAE